MANKLLKTADHFHAKEIDVVLTTFETSSQGLTSQEATKRLKEYGLNELNQGKRINPLSIFLRQFKNLMVAVLLAAAALSTYFQHYLDTGVIIFVILLNSIIGFIQEFKAERAIAALKKLVVQKAKVKRDGRVIEIPATQIVPGDVVVIEEGDKIPADARIIKYSNALISESLLTGESLPVDKNTTVLPYQTSMADRKNMAYSGTILVRGSIEAVVIATGNNTMLGSIAASLNTIKESEGHFQKKNNQLVKHMSIIAFVVALFTFVIGFFLRALPLADILPFSLAALVSGIPESLPIIIIVILSLSARRMAKRNAIVRSMTSTETLSVVNIIITDKTGTLTQNKMTVSKVALPKNKKDLTKLITIAKYCNNVRLQKDENNQEVYMGDPTEIAFYKFAQDQITKPLKQLKLADFPFNQHLKVRASVVNSPNGLELYVVGAPEIILSKSKLKNVEKIDIHKQLDNMTNDAMRPIGFAYKRLNRKPKRITEDMIENLSWSGAVGLMDPPRAETSLAIKKAKKAGIRVIMATGDHPKTAVAIAKQIGLSSNGTVLAAADLEQMTDNEILKASLSTNVFARMTPDAKLRLSKILQKAGNIVAMTGDGVNDAPTLKNADIGIAMGQGGTDVSREAADIVLADDNFATIIAAIEEGRTQFRNIRRTSFFLVTTNLAEGTSLLIFLLLGLPLPLLPKQILWLNIVGSGVTDVALATEGIHEDVLDSPPRSKSEGILSKSMIPLLILLTLTMAISALCVFFIMQPLGEIKARTAVFVVLSLMQIMNMFNMRSLKKSIFKVGVFNNKNINLAFIASIALLLTVVYIPPFAKLFEFEALTFIEFTLLVIASLSVLAIGEAVKSITQRKN